METNRPAGLQLIECPRDAMQGLAEFIPTDRKIAYLNRLLKVGFHTLDFGSFVSPKAVPQMRDTPEVLAGLELAGSPTKLLAIVANIRGAVQALAFEQISYLGYPISVSETFQQKNTNRSIGEALRDLAHIADLCRQHDRQVVAYISMGFGNPYGDPYSPGRVSDMAAELAGLGVAVISLADTLGMAAPGDISRLFAHVSAISGQVEWGVHLHATPAEAADKVRAALRAGCRRIDGAVLGYGGCPLSGRDLVGNINTRTILEVARQEGYPLPVNETVFTEAEQLAAEIFGT